MTTQWMEKYDHPMAADCTYQPVAAAAKQLYCTVELY
jgi:hypothetical protein